MASGRSSPLKNARDDIAAPSCWTSQTARFQGVRLRLVVAMEELERRLGTLSTETTPHIARRLQVLNHFTAELYSLASPQQQTLITCCSDRHREISVRIVMLESNLRRSIKHFTALVQLCNYAHLHNQAIYPLFTDLADITTPLAVPAHVATTPINIEHVKAILAALRTEHSAEAGLELMTQFHNSCCSQSHAC